MFMVKLYIVFNINQYPLVGIQFIQIYENLYLVDEKENDHNILNNLNIIYIYFNDRFLNNFI